MDKKRFEIDPNEAIILNQQKAEDLEEMENEKEEKLAKTIEHQLKYYQIFSVVLSVAIMFIFNFLSYLSQSLSIFALQKEFQMNPYEFLSYIINFILLLLLIVFFMFIPKMTKPKMKIILSSFFGFFAGMVIYGIKIYFVSVELTFRQKPFYLFDVVIFIPYLALSLLSLYDEKDSEFICDVYCFLLATCITIACFDYRNAINLKIFFRENPFFSSLLLFIFLLLLTMQVLSIRRANNKNKENNTPKMIKYNPDKTDLTYFRKYKA